VWATRVQQPSTCRIGGALHPSRAIPPPGERACVVFRPGCGIPFFTTDHAAALRAAPKSTPIVGVQSTKVEAVLRPGPAHHRIPSRYRPPSPFRTVLTVSWCHGTHQPRPLPKDNSIPDALFFDLFSSGQLSAGSVRRRAYRHQHHSPPASSGFLPIATSWTWIVEAEHAQSRWKRTHHLQHNPAWWRARANLPLPTSSRSSITERRNTFAFLATLSTPDSQTLQISPSIVFDGPDEKAIA